MIFCNMVNSKNIAPDHVHTRYGHGYKPKKTLGQNFLKSEPALRMMCEAGAVTIDDIILEIGPGKGALTSKLLAQSKKVIAIEKDRDLIDILKEKFKEEIEKGRLELLYKDILLYDPTSSELTAGEYKIISNIPYNITGAIIERFLSQVIQPSTMVLLVQKEVAERIVARDNKESILSLSVKAYGSPRYMMKVGKRFFTPSPKVDSAIIAITDISPVHTRYGLEERGFFTLVKAGFAHKRKVLRTNLESILPKEKIQNLYEIVGLDTRVRAEDLPFEKWIEIEKYLSKNL